MNSLVESIAVYVLVMKYSTSTVAVQLALWNLFNLFNLQRKQNL